ncbi:MarR family transcriptional regulator [Cryobacterium sp. RTC2.1]|uniref:MarR family winged helix-turn-helix transcriptional regulator n=1 Tax=Cryobacterium sp. RTC2.1 TaxID=3048634 RepID=UPI002B232741|nr:MarR family transcriptional regulator [Cryobacterium sp. RTC2.1]MEB0003191.1 MarR family transcriptional regulator [Cryobacterium sp. RTC2.1]
MSIPPSGSANPGDPERIGPAPSVSPAEMRAWAAIVETANIVQFAADRQLRDAVGLTLAQFEILLRLLEAPEGRLRMTDIADALTVSRSGLTYQVARLEALGLVERRPSPGDERSVIAHITAAGRAALAAGGPGYVTLVREMLFDRIGPEELATVTEILGDVRAQLRSRPKRSAFRRSRGAVAAGD